MNEEQLRDFIDQLSKGFVIDDKHIMMTCLSQDNFTKYLTISYVDLTFKEKDQELSVFKITQNSQYEKLS